MLDLVAGTSAGQYTPYALSGGGRRRGEEAGVAAERQFQVALENRRPTLPVSGSLTVTRRCAVACSLVGGVRPVGAEQPHVDARELSSPPRMPNSTASAQAAFASMSSPVSTSVIVLR